MWCLHCTAIINLHLIAHRHHLITQLPEQAREFSVLCCRIISGISIIDPGEPSVTMMWYESPPLTVLMRFQAFADTFPCNRFRIGKTLGCPTAGFHRRSLFKSQCSSRSPTSSRNRSKRPSHPPPFQSRKRNNKTDNPSKLAKLEYYTDRRNLSIIHCR